MRLWDLYEDIPRPPRNLTLFLKNRLKEVQSLKDLLDKTESMKFDWGALKDAGSTARQMDEQLGEAVEDLEHFVQRKDLARLVDDYVHSLTFSYELLSGKYKEDSMVGDRIRTNLERNIDWIGRFEERFGEHLDAYVEASKRVDELREQLREDGYFDERYADEEELQNFETVLKGLEVAGVIAQSVKGIIASKAKLEDVFNLQAAHAYGNKPKPQDQETMFHVSAYADEIAANGFLPKKPSPKERYGLGSYGDESAGAIGTHTSFTHDIGNARQIHRALRELVMIANGQLRKHQVLRWLQDEGIDLKDVAFNLPGVSGHKWQEDLAKLPDNPLITAKIYHAWLWLNKIGRMNPLFANIDKAVTALKGQKVEDVGIIKSLVNMTDPTIEYVAAEQEWRVPASAVLSVERVQ